MTEEIVILHTNDLHSHLEMWPVIRRYLLTRQEALRGANKFVLTVDLGDFSDRVHPLTEATDGKANTLLMNQVNYDVVTIGNNEGVGNSREQLNHLYDQANFAVLLANLRGKAESEQPAWAEPYTIITSEKGTRIGLIGLTAPFPLTYNPNGWDVFQTDEVLPDILRELGPKSDVIVLLSHLGINEETRIASLYPQIDLILGSHTHHLLPEGKVVNKTLLAAAGKFGGYIGEVTLKLADHQLLSRVAQVVNTASLPAFTTDKLEISNYLRQGHQLLKEQQVACLPHELSHLKNDATSLIAMALRAAKEFAKVDVSLLNSGLFLTTLKAGEVTKDDLHHCLPHPMHLVKLTLKGSDLLAFIAEICEQAPLLKDYPIVGMGFRGKVFGELQANGLSWQGLNSTVRWQGQPIDALRAYTFVTVDHLLFVPFFPTLAKKAQVEMLFPEFIRNVVADYLAAHYPCC